MFILRMLVRTACATHCHRAAAACRGNLKILQWLHARGTPWIEQVSLTNYGNEALTTNPFFQTRSAIP
jgi:hypothetical protein